MRPVIHPTMSTPEIILENMRTPVSSPVPARSTPIHAIQLILLLAIPLHVLAAPATPADPAAQATHPSADAKFRFHFDSTKAPNLAEWMLKDLQPVVEQWYPASKGAALRDPAQAKHDASYRISANCIDWVITVKDKNLLEKFNTAASEGRYSDDLWKTWTGTALPELAAEWHQAVVADTR